MSPIDAKGASKKYGRARARVHTAYTTFPQAPKSQNSIHCVSQLHAFAEEKSAAPPLEQDIFGRNLEKFSTHAVEKHGATKINCHLLDPRELKLGICLVETLQERGPFVFGIDVCMLGDRAS